MKISRGSTYLRGGIWWYQLRRDGVREQGSLGTSIKAEALKRFAEIKENLLMGIDQRRVEGISFVGLWKKYQALELTKKAPVTQDRIAGLCKRLLRYFGDKPVSRITQEDIDQFIVSCQGLKPNSINKYVATLSQILSVGIGWGYLKQNPVKSARPLKVQDKPIPYLTNEQITAILGACNDFYRVLVITLFSTGARIGEAMSLTWKDIDFEKGMITLHGHKTYEIRTVPLTGGVKKELARLNRDGEQIFQRKLETVKNQVINICRRAGFPGVSAHTFRHTYITRLVASGMDLRSVMALSGHKRLATLQRYAHLAPGFMAGVDERLGYNY